MAIICLLSRLGAGQAALTATSVQVTTNVVGHDFRCSHAVDTTVVGANQFVISGNAGMDAANLAAKINSLQEVITRHRPAAR